MRRSMLLLISTFLASSAISWAADDFRDWSKDHGKVSPTWVLPKKMAPQNMLWTVPDMAGSHKSGNFHEPDVCGGCHAAIIGQWKGSMMGNAWNDPVFQSVYATYLKKAKTHDEQSETAMCSRCHTPIGYLDDDQARYHVGNLPAVSASGVSCDVCHSVAASAGTGNGAFILQPGNAAKDEAGTKFGPRRDAVSPFHGTNYSQLHTRSDMCGMCHDVGHAHNIMPVENTYTEWRQSPYNTGDSDTSTHCQDCHMRQDEKHPATGSTPRPNISGFSADEGMGAKKRDHIWQHNFVGGNLAVTALLGHNPQATMAADRLKNAVTIEEVSATPLQKGGVATLTLKVTNSGAGHYLPTGLTYVREMWLDVKVADADGKLVYRSGDLDEKGNIRKGAVIYKTVLGEGGKERKPTFFLPAAVQILSDKRIRPGGHSIEDFTFSVPGTARHPLTFAVKMRYRSAPQWLIDELLGEKAPQLPIFDMATLRGTL